MESLFALLTVLIVIGVCLYLVNTYVLPSLPVDPPIRAAIMAILVLILILWLLMTFLGGGGVALHR